MARNGSGVYTKVNTFTASNPITASGHNQNWDDIATEITNSVAADGQTGMTGPLKASNGTASNPGITFAGDQNTGIYRIGADNLGIAVNGAKVVDVAATGASVTGDVAASGVVKQGGFALQPIGVVFPYAGASAPSGFLLCYGQAVSRSTYSALFAITSTTYGSGDGSTTFNLPDLRGRVVAAPDAMGGNAANRLTDAVAGIDALGDAGGAQSVTLSLSQLPTGITSSGSNTITVATSGTNLAQTATGISNGSFQNGAGGIAPNSSSSWTGTSSLSGSNSISVTSNNTSGNAHNNVQPTLILNYIIFAGV